jgi:protein phosphatase
VYVAPEEIAIAHVGDSRAYRLRDGGLERLTEDHSLVDELVRQGKITPAEAADHPQRSVITRALGPEPAVEIDTRTYRARAGDVYLLCSDGLTTMLDEGRVEEILRSHPRLRDAGEALIAAANEAGGRDNITVVMFRLDDPGALTRPADPATEEQGMAAPAEPASAAPAPDPPPPPPEPPPAPAESEPPAPEIAASREPGAPGAQDLALPGVASATGGPPTGTPPAPQPVQRRSPRMPTSAEEAGRARKRRRARRLVPIAIALVVLGLLASGAYLTLESVYFIGTNGRGLVTLYRGVPYQLPGGIKLYSSEYVTGVAASALAPARRHTLLDHTLRSESDAAGLLRSLELGQLRE